MPQLKKLLIPLVIAIFIIPLVYALASTIVPHPTAALSYSGYVTEGAYAIQTSTQLTATCYGRVNISDEIYCFEDEGTNARDPYFAANFTMPSGTINSVMITGKGNSSSTSAGLCVLGIYNYTAAAWRNVNTSSCDNTPTTTLRFNLSTSQLKTDMINGGKVQVMFWINSTTVTDDLYVDYMAANVDYTSAATDSCTPPAANNNWEVRWSDNCSMNAAANLGTGNFTLNCTSGSGSFYLNSTLTAYKISLIPKNANTCRLSILTGGRIIGK